MLSGIAILCIVFFHIGSYSYLSQIGLGIFSFVAGYKLIYNHKNEIRDKDFLKQYAIKRFIRLYKPYIGYTALVIVPLYLVCQLALMRGLDYPGLRVFSRGSLPLVMDFLGGENPFAYQLWYLVTLLGITLMCLAVIYIDIRGLYLLLPLSLISNRFTLYASIFVLGALLAYHSVFVRFPAPTAFVYLGRMSFYIYLFHWPLILPITQRFLEDILGLKYVFMPIIICPL